VIDASGVFYRCAAKSRPLTDWDARATSRFSAPSLPFPVLYLAKEKLTAFWECFGDELNDQPDNDKALYEKAHLGPRQWVLFNVRPALRVIDVTETATLRRMGADASTFFAEYTVSQKWAAALMAHPAKLDGFCYGSRLDGGKRCLAVFGRPSLQASAASRIRAKANGGLLEDAELLGFLARQGVAVL
jgi:hypothetical protein